MQESEAIARLKGGDISGLETLVQLYYQPALRIAFLICRDPALTEDVVQSAFVRVYERIGQFDAQRPFEPWFMRSVANDALKAIRRRPDRAWNALVAQAQTRSSDTPEGLLLAAETRTEFRAVVERLSPTQRAVVVLRYYYDLSDSEVAQHLGVPAGTVRRRLHDARQRLRQLLPAFLQPFTSRPRPDPQVQTADVGDTDESTGHS